MYDSVLFTRCKVKSVFWTLSASPSFRSLRFMFHVSYVPLVTEFSRLALLNKSLTKISGSNKNKKPPTMWMVL